jgi:hypothetical protein
MAWIECHDTVWDHHKLYRLCTALNQPDYAVVGRLISLWHFVLQNAWRDSNLEPWGDEVIEKKSRWDGEKGVFVKALRDCGFMDGFVVHGWQKRAGRLVQDRRRNERRKKQRSTGGKTADGRRRTASKLAATLPNPTLPNPTKPNLIKEKPAHVQFVDRFKESYEAMTGLPFKYGDQQFIIAKKLSDKYGFDIMVEKVKVLGILCRDRSAWFTKSGWGDFSIETLSGKWNSIIPQAAGGKDQELLEELKKQEVERERANSAMGR